MDSTAFKELQKWMESPTAKAKEATAQTNAWAAFTKQFPNANKTQFVAQISIDEKRSITVASKRVWFRQALLESENESRSWFRRHGRVSILIVANEK